MEPRKIAQLQHDPAAGAKASKLRSKPYEEFDAQLKFAKPEGKKQIIQEKLLYEGEPFTQTVPSDLFYGKVEIVQEESFEEKQSRKQAAKEAVMVHPGRKVEKPERQEGAPQLVAKNKPSIAVEAIEEEHQQNMQASAEGLEKSPMTSELRQGGQKTPQVPGLDLNKLHSNKGKQQNKIELPSEQTIEKADPYLQKPGKTAPDLDSAYSQQTVSSYRGIFNRMGLPLPRSARVKVDLDLLQKDPKISEQLKQIVNYKDMKGRQILEDGKRENLISERTYEVHSRKLEKWVTSTRRKIEEQNPFTGGPKKQKIQDNLELIQDAEDNKHRLQKVMYEGESGRQHSYLSQSGRAGLSDRRGGNKGESTFSQNPSYRGGAQSHKGDTFTDRDPYGNGAGSGTFGNQNVIIGSGRQQKSKLIELIQGESSRSSSKPKPDHNSSDSKKLQPENSSYGAQHDPLATELLKLDDIRINLKEAPAKLNERRILAPEGENEAISDYQFKPRDESPQPHQRTEKSLNRSQSYPTIINEMEAVEQAKLERMNEDSGDEDQEAAHGTHPSKEINHDDIEIQLEDALMQQKRKETSFEFSPALEAGSNVNSKVGTHQTSEDSSANHLEDLRDPRFFTNKLEEDLIDVPPKQNPFVPAHRNQTSELVVKKHEAGSSSLVAELDSQPAPGTSLSEEKDRNPASLFAEQNSNPIKVENQSQEEVARKTESTQVAPSAEQPSGEKKEQRSLGEPGDDTLAPGHPNSPQSDSQGFEFSKIQTGAHSLSSTDSDMAKAIQAANKEVLESPPNLISPKGAQSAAPGLSLAE